MRAYLGCSLLVFTICAAVCAPAQSPPCSFSSTTHAVYSDAGTLWQGVKSAPRNSVRPENLAWELPIGAATGVLIAEVDRPAVNRIQSKSLQDTSGLWSNVGLFTELAAGGVAWTMGCAGHHSAMGEAGFTALAAAGAAMTVDLAMKLTFARQYPYAHDTTAEFWEGGHSFPSGHAATSFAFASTVAHRYPHNPWIKWGAYALASGVSMARYPAKKHYPSDILVGAALGYVTGSYMADHTVK